MTPERIAELRALCENATPGAWTSNINDYGDLIHAGNMLVAEIRGWGHLTGKLGLSEDEVTKIQDANCALIAAARTALPELLDALEAMTKRAAEMEAGYRFYGGCTACVHSGDSGGLKCDVGGNCGREKWEPRPGRFEEARFAERSATNGKQ